MVIYGWLFNNIHRAEAKKDGGVLFTGDVIFCVVCGAGATRAGQADTEYRKMLLLMLLAYMIYTLSIHEAYMRHGLSMLHPATKCGNMLPHATPVIARQRRRFSIVLSTAGIGVLHIQGACVKATGYHLLF